MSVSFSIDKLANSGTPIEIDGKVWLISQLTLRDQGKLQTILKTIQPSPMSQVVSMSRTLSPDSYAMVLRDARKDMLFWPSPITTAEGLNLILTNEEGQKALLSLSLGKLQEMSEATIADLVDKITYTQFIRIASIAISGEDPDNDPKS